MNSNVDWGRNTLKFLIAGTNLWRQMNFHGDVRWPVTHSENVHSQLNVPWDILALHVLRMRD